MLVALLIGMVSGTWAEDVTVTYTFTSRDWTATVDGAEANWTSNKQGAGFSNNGIQVTNNSTYTGANGTTPVEYSNIKKIVATYNTNKSSGAGSIVAKIGNNNETSNNVAYSSGDGRTANYTTEFTYSTSQSGAVTITVNTTTNSIYLVSIAITYEKAAVETSPLASIAVDASSARTVFHVGDEFTYEGAVVTATYEDESTNDVTSDATFSTPDMTSVGTKTVTVSYTENGVEKTTSYYITVNAPAALSSISLSGTYPTEFTQGDAFSAEGIVITANYDDGTTKDVTDDATFSGYDMTATGEQTVTVTYGEKTANYIITVNEYVMPSELTIDFESELSTYSEWAFSGIGTTNTAITANNGAKYGATINSGGNGMASSTITTKNKVNPEKITFYVSKVSTNITSSSWYVEVSEDGETWTKVGDAASATNMSKGSWNEVSRDLSSYSNVYVRIRYNGSTAIRTIDDIILEMATPKVLSSIALSGDYATTFYVGDAFSTEGMTVTATYDNGKTADVTASATFSGYDMTNAGEHTVTVSYTEGEVTKTATYTITIKAPPTLTSISVTVNNPIELYQGDEFSSEGIVVTANYDDDTTKDVTADATFSGYDMSTTGEQTVTVTYGEKTDTYTIIVVVKKGTQNNPYTVAEAVDAIDNNGTTSSVYVTGIVSQVDSYSSGAITYWISADGTTTDQFEVYKGKNSNGDNFSSVDDVKVGDVVVVRGNIVLYNSSIYEFSSGSQLVSQKRQGEADLSFETTEFQINVNEEFEAPTLSNPHNLTVTYSSSNEDLAFYDETTGELLITENAEGVVTITATFAGNDDYKAGSASYTLTIVDNSKTPVTLAFSEESYTADLDEEFTAPVLSSDVADLTFTYTSDNEEVAMVDESTGEVVLMSTGTAVITATFAGNDTYASATASYTLVVTQAKTLPYQQLFTTSLGDWTQSDAYWTQSSNYGAVANASTAGAYDLVSPEIRLTANKQINVAINHAGRYLNSTYQDECQLLVKAAGGEWEAVPVTTWFTNTNWTYVDAAMVLDQKYAGQKVQFALRYAPQSNPSSSGKWEVKSFSVTATELPKPEPTFAFEQESYSVEIGGELTITASSDESDGTITYTSSDENIAMIDASTGEILALAEGIATITATIAATESYASATASVQLTITDSREVATVTFVDVPETININTSATYAATAFDGAEITYTSSATNVVTVDETTGEILALAEGVATITATTAATATYKAGSASYTITVVDPNKTYYALVSEYDGKYYAVNAQGGTTWGATEVEDVVNGKVLNGTDDIAWEIIPNGKAVGLRNKTKTDNGSWIYIGYAKSGTNLQSSSSIVSWTVDSDNKTWTNQNGNTSGTVRSIIYNNDNSVQGFKNYAVSNVNGSSYGSYTHAYTFADGYVRTVTAGNWGTFCVDHTIAAADYSGVKFYSIAGKDKNENYISLKEETELMAGVAYIFQANEGATKLIAAYSDESIEEPFEASDNNGLAGSFTGQDVEEGMYLLSGGKIVRCGTGCTIAANRAYIDMDYVPVLGNESASEGLVKLFLGTTDAVRGIDADNLNGAVIYDLSGRRLQNAQRGLYIVNGKKVAVK